MHKILCYVARHGTTDLNGASGVGHFRGKMDVDLDSKGRADARALAKYFSPIDISEIYSSDRRRADETAHTIADSKGMQIWSTPHLRAWNVGDVFSGKPKTQENLEHLEEFIAEPSRVIPGGESLDFFKGRIRPILWHLFERGNANQHPVLAVSHSSVIHEVGSMLYGDHHAVLVEPGGVVEVYRDDRGTVHARPVFKARVPSPHKADTVS